MDVKMIVAVGKDGAIGKNGKLIWKIPEDLKRFKSLTLGHPVIMGRKTWESLPSRPLPGRRNIVLTRQKDFQAPGAEVVYSVEAALKDLDEDSPFIIGGAEIYNEFLPYVTELYLTVVEDTCQDADSFLNLELSSGWQILDETPIAKSPSGISYRYITFKKTR